MVNKVSEQFNGAVSAGFIKSAIAIIRGFQKMMTGYKTKPLDIDLVLFKPVEASTGLIQKVKSKLFKSSQKTLGWDQIVNSIEVEDVAGDHHSMLNKSHAEGLSHKIMLSLIDANSDKQA